LKKAETLRKVTGDQLHFIDEVQ